jgi:ABC-type Fe3+/spermidine/putrescine transport system ATPase subunit
VSCSGIEINGRSPQNLSAGDAVLVALRFEKIVLTPGGGSDGLAGTVVEENYMGATVRRHVLTRDGINLISEASNTQATPDLGVGCLVNVGWSADAPNVLRD